MKVREPVPRPLDVLVAELILSASQAFLAGVLLYLAVGVWADRGAGFGPMAIVLAMLGICVGGGWLYWLAGGVGWPLAAANVPTAMFLGFALVLGWQGDDLVHVEGVPLLLSVAASVYGIVCGVFLDSPRRWRWDQRQKPRPGTVAPRVSPATRAFVAQVPRSLPRRSSTTLERADLLTQVGAAQAPSGGTGGGLSPTAADEPSQGETAQLADERSDVIGGGPAEAPDRAPSAMTGTPAGPSMSTERLDQAARAGSGEAPAAEPPTAAERGAIELPTSLEPRAQRSPWAWAAPPEWNRDEDDEQPSSRSSGGR